MNRFLRTPKNSRTLIIVAFILWIIYPFFDIWTFWELDRRWMEPEIKLHQSFCHKDSCQLIDASKHFPWRHVLLGAICLNLVILPFLIFIFWLCLRKYKGNLSLFTWDRKRPWRSIMWTIIFLSAFLMELRAGAIFLAQKIPPYGILIFAWAYLILHLRATMVGKFINH
ncbi:MAG: hypothetical protein ACOY3I_04710 [Verrucomicrobiota bacterium]